MQFTGIDGTLQTFTGLMMQAYKGQSVKFQAPSAFYQGKITTTEERDDLIDPQEDPSIELVIQNDDKFNAFIAAVKSPMKTSGVLFVQDSFVIGIIRPNEAHPVLIMRLPINGKSVFVKRANLCFDLPLEAISIKPHAGPSQVKGRALYYKKEGSSYSLHYISRDGKNNVHQSVVETRTFDYLNHLLQTTSLMSFEIQEKDVIDKNLGNLNNIEVLLMVKSAAIASFKEGIYRKDERLVEFNITPDTFTMWIYRTSAKSEDNQIGTAKDRDATIWLPNAIGDYKMLDRTMLLKSNNSSLISSSNCLYYIMGTFGTIYVFIKLICLKPIEPSEEIASYNLLKMIGNNYHIFEMYYCEKVK